ncbi:MAG: hypothetical protein GVY26_06505 [Bacteroidetes bacterium]|nr:hypothetical protein [Bacteroidota bacterium]
MKTIHLLCYCCLLLASPAMAQLTDDFSDGDFTNEPEWLGDTEKFVVNNGELQLQDTEAGSSQLYVPAATSTAATTTWRFYIRLEFAPSTSNNARVYLNADANDLLGDLQGYYLQIGGISGDQDALELYRQDGSSETLLISGQAGALGSEPAEVRVQVQRSTAGEWTLQADYSGGTDFVTEGTATDDTYSMGGFFGWVCDYTSTRSDLFFLDDVLVDPLFVDTTPPFLQSASADNAFTVNARFNEPLDPASANDASRYSLSPAVGVVEAELQADLSTVRLSLGDAMENLQSYTLTIDGVADAEGNVAATQSQDFTFVQVEEAEAGDLIITELMPDPTPARGLPETEYLEIHNRSGKVIELSTLGVASGGSPEALPDVLLLPGEYVTVCDEEFADAFAPFGKTAGVPSFPSLSNSGDEAAIVRLGGPVLFELSYTDDWYQDPNRSDGGYSLELIALEGPYDCPGNWRAAANDVGGTPGQANSVLGTAMDQTPPLLLRAAPESELDIRLTFSEVMDEMSAGDLANYQFEPALAIMDVILLADRTEALLVLSEPLQPGTAYTLTVEEAVQDCIGNGIVSNTTQVGLAEAAEAQDVVINEILFDPNTGGSDFVELYNRSDKIIDLLDLQLLNTRKMSGDVEGRIDGNLLIFPGEYLVLSEDPDNISMEYTVPQPANLVLNDLPSLDNDEGNLTLRLEGVTLDSFDYFDDYHYALLDDEEGVSLERVSPGAPTQDAGNWHSAASTVGFATPTGPNSQFFEQPGELPNIINIPNRRFSPDGDGFEDVLLVNYETNQPGYTLNLWVFDAAGREIARLQNNEILANRGTLKWDGVAADGSPARAGIYVLFFELFTPDGTVERQKEAVVLAGQLD